MLRINEHGKMIETRKYLSYHEYEYVYQYHY